MRQKVAKELRKSAREDYLSSQLWRRPTGQLIWRGLERVYRDLKKAYRLIKQDRDDRAACFIRKSRWAL